METTLVYIETLSVAQFKLTNGISKLQIIKNPQTGKTFFSCPDNSNYSGKVSKTIKMDGDLFISKCTDTAGGEHFYMLHNKSANEANVMATL